jgi:acetylornithine deacetylase/succinyl-diaminopimelate desuccinylase-like protein
MSEIDFAKHIDAEELAALALRLANTFSPAGHEQPLAEVVHGWFEQNRIPVRLQPILPDRANVVAALQGTGGGVSLIFNSHLDTEVSGPEYDWGMAQPDINKVGAHREGKKLLGHTILNDRGLMALP